jgi:hypothetical protein
MKVRDESEGEMTQQAFEVNTDISLIDPDWEDFEDAHNRRYGLAIDYVKAVVKGKSYSNKVMDLVVGRCGFYAQAKNFPAAFYGDLGEASLERVPEADARAAVWEASAYYRAGEALSLSCIYGSGSAGEVFFGYRFDASERYEFGNLSPNLPMHLRVVVDAASPVALLGERRGVLIYQRGTQGEHYLLRAHGRRQPFPCLDGFSD